MEKVKGIVQLLTQIEPALFGTSMLGVFFRVFVFFFVPWVISLEMKSSKIIKENGFILT